MKLDERCTIVSKKGVEKLGQNIWIWQLARRTKEEVEGITHGENVE